MVDSQSQLRLKRLGPCAVEIRQSYPSNHLLNTECSHRVFKSVHPSAHSCRPSSQQDKHDSQHWPAFLLAFGLKQTQQDVQALHYKVQQFRFEDKPKDKLLHSVGQRGSSEGYFCYPRGLSVASDGELAIADTENHRVQLFNSAGVFKNIIGRGKGSAPGELDSPLDVAWMPTGNYAVADTGNNRVQIFRPKGSLRMMFLTRAAPVAIACDAGHNIIVVSEARQIEMYRKGCKFDKSFPIDTPTGAKSAAAAAAIASPVQMYSVAANRQLIALCDTACGVARLFDYDGVCKLTFEPAASRPGLAVLPTSVDLSADLLLIADATNHTVNVYALTGKFHQQALGPVDDLGNVQCARFTPEGHLAVTEFAANGLHCLKVFRFAPCDCHSERPTSAKKDKSTPIPKTHYTSDLVVPQ
ncbi:hypothetical protein BOX15_Mlig011571g1 [Macrostomum lignano]|uniref:Uncharacterized protein n=1 Tax=Macrostomum lignano TaxID=282301 RepID=A0A267GFZ2_9PLAT|nr:hypothetical protein BOX15_Mlig011571g1 [Macrostomum lignano]